MSNDPLKRFLKCLPKTRVVSLKDLSKRYTQCVEEYKSRGILGLLKLKSREEVLEVVLAANKEPYLSLSVFSTGKNWGLGSKMPHGEPTVLLDLSELNGLKWHSKNKGVVLLEPGVTQMQLSEFLKGSPFMCNVTGSCNYTSIIGNAMERGVGFYRQRTKDVVGLRVVTGEGKEILVGGFTPSGGQNENSYIYQHGVGPELMPLFFQSSYGLVTEAAVELIHVPEEQCLYYVDFDEEAYPSMIGFLKEMYVQKMILSSSKIYNANAMETYWKEERNRAFRLYFSIEGSKDVFPLKSTVVENSIRSLGKQFSKFNFSGPVSESESRSLDREILRIFNGTPDSCSDVREAFNVKDCQLEENGNPGWRLFLPIVPFDTQVIKEAYQVVLEAMAFEGLRLNTVMNILDEKAIDMVISIRFERNALGVEKVDKTYELLMNRFRKMNIYSYRQDIDHSSKDQFVEEAYVKSLDGLKRVFDPHKILQPNKYN